jgi:HK97 family phage portal protein
LGFFQRQANRLLWKLAERRSSLENPQTPLSYPAEWLLDIFNGGRTSSGIRVSELTALQTDAVLACVKIICGAISSIPANVYERQTKGNRMARRIAHDHPLFDLLQYSPNPEMTSTTFRSTLQSHLLLWGNGYAEIQRNNGNNIIALWPRNPARTRPVRLTSPVKIEGTEYPVGTLVYRTNDVLGDEPSDDGSMTAKIGVERIILAEDMIHMVGLSLDGRLGQDVIWLAREIVGLALATQKFGSKFFANGAIPAGILEIPNMLEAKAIENLRRSWMEAHGGENAHRTAVLEQGVKYTPISTDPEKSQFLSTREYQRTAIAAIFQVPPYMIGEKVTGKSSVEQSSIEFLTYGLNPWIRAWEQELKRKLFPLEKPKTANFFVSFDTRHIVYGDAESRAKYYTSGKTGGYLNTNDIREMEGLNPVTDGSGEVYWMPVNMQDAANPLTAPHIGGKQIDAGAPKPQLPPAGPKPELPLGGAPQNTPEGKGGSKTQAEEQERYVRILTPAFTDAFNRAWSRPKLDAKSFTRCFIPAMFTLIEIASGERASEGMEVTAVELQPLILEHLDGMHRLAVGIAEERRAEHIERELRRTVEFFTRELDRRYNPSHKDQPRKPDGKWHSGMKPFYLMRHGTTDDDVADVWSGWDSVPLNAQGIAEVDSAIEALKGEGIKRIITSSIHRAKQTAYRVAAGLGDIPVEIDARLNALNVGDFAKMNEKDNAHRLQLYFDNPDEIIPGSDESVNMYLKRTNEAINEAREKNEETGPILVLAHSSTIASYLNGANLENSSDLLSPAGVVRLDGKQVKVLHGTLAKGDAA